MRAWLNGNLVEESQAAVSIFDRSYLYGEGIFETLMCYGGRPAFLSRHYQRLQRNCEKIGISLNFSQRDLEHNLSSLITANQLVEGVVRITLSTVGASFGVKRPENPKHNLSFFCRTVEIDPKLFENGVVVLPLTALTNDEAQTAGIKSTSYLIKMLARARSGEAGTYESLLKNSKGQWVEGSRTNLFIVLDRVVITAPLSDGLLPGITREVVLEILNTQKIPHREDHITDVMLQNAEEIFLTGSTSEVMPVCEVRGLWKKKVAPDWLTLKLQKEYHALAHAV